MARFRIVQSGIEVAAVDAPDRDEAYSHIRHYAIQYVIEGDVTIEERYGRKWCQIETMHHMGDDYVY